jgi:hypothetical protein
MRVAFRSAKAACTAVAIADQKAPIGLLGKAERHVPDRVYSEVKNAFERTISAADEIFSG